MPYWGLFYHVIWSTKGRLPVISEEVETAIRRSLKLTFADLDAIPHAVGIMPDHMHVVVSVPPKISPMELVKRMKGASSRAIHKEIDLSFAWQGEYGVLSFGEQALATVRAYVENQREHHAAGTLWPGLERTSDEDRKPIIGRLRDDGTEE